MAENSYRWYVWPPTRLLLAGSGSDVTGNHVTWPNVTASNPELTSFDRKSPGSGCWRLKTCILGTFELLQGCNSQEVAVSREFMWAEVTQNWCHFTECQLEVAVQGRKCNLEPLQGWNSQELAVTWQEMTSRDRKWPESDVISPEVIWKRL